MRWCGSQCLSSFLFNDSNHVLSVVVSKSHVTPLVDTQLIKTWHCVICWPTSKSYFQQMMRVQITWLAIWRNVQSVEEVAPTIIIIITTAIFIARNWEIAPMRHITLWALRQQYKAFGFYKSSTFLQFLSDLWTLGVSFATHSSSTLPCLRKMYIPNVCQNEKERCSIKSLLNEWHLHFVLILVCHTWASSVIDAEMPNICFDFARWNAIDLMYVIFPMSKLINLM